MDDAETHARWRDTAINDGGIGPVGYPLLADTSKQMTADYNVLHEESGFSARGTFLIDPDGKIAKVYDTVVPAEHPDQVLADLG